MASFRAQFYEALQTMLTAVNDPLLLDGLPVASTHNIRARILRHGIAVSTFAMLEKYSRSAFESIVQDIAASTMLYTDLPEKMKQFLLVEAISGLNNYAYFTKDTTLKLATVESGIEKIASFKANPPVYTNFGFSPTGSNIGNEDIKLGFKNLGLKDAWGRMKTISTTIGAGYVSLEDEYRSLARARNTSAHDPASNIPTSTLEAYVKAAIVLGITIDLLGKAVGREIRSCSDKTKLDAKLTAISFNMRFLDLQLDGTWGERATSTGKLVKKYPNRVAGVAGVHGRAGNPAAILRDLGRTPLELA